MRRTSSRSPQADLAAEALMYAGGARSPGGRHLSSRASVVHIIVVDFLAVFGLLGIAIALVVFGAKAIRSAHDRDADELDALRAAGEEPIIGGARIGSWTASSPLAMLILTETALFVGGRFRYVPLHPLTVDRADVATIETRQRLLGGEALRIILRSGETAATFVGRGAADQLRRLDWPVAGVADRS